MKLSDRDFTRGLAKWLKLLGLSLSEVEGDYRASWGQKCRLEGFSSGMWTSE